MKRLSIAISAIIGVALGFAANLAVEAQQPPHPAPQVPAAARPRPPHPRGARSSRHHWLAYQATRHPRFVHMPRAVPPSFGTVPATLNMWGNDVYGDCVSAEEAFAKACYSVQLGLTEVFVPQQTVIDWAAKNGYLNGADLTSVMDSMAQSGMTAADGKTYTDGPYQSVDYTNDATLRSAIFTGPVKIGVAANQLQNVVGNGNGWVATGFRQDGNEDHCVALCGYGTMQQCCAMVGAAVPAGVNPSGLGYLLFTWDTIGVIDQASMLAITGEAWIRNPTTPQDQPTPVPTPPSPAPPPSGLAYALTGSVPAGAAIDPATGTFTWAVPATQGAGTVTISFTATNAAGSASGSFQILISAAAGSAPVIAPIPQQAATAGSTFSFGVGTYVTVPSGQRPAAPAAPPRKSAYRTEVRRLPYPDRGDGPGEGYDTTVSSALGTEHTMLPSGVGR